MINSNRFKISVSFVNVHRFIEIYIKKKEKKKKQKAVSEVDFRAGFVLGCGRSSPIWNVSSAAKNKEDLSERISTLAEPKKTHRDYLPARDVRY